jgi:UDP-N-acetylmuramate--alanine ligase
MLKNCHSIFFIGIGGISMSSLAQISLSLGYAVGGSDRSENPQTLQLKGMGIPVFPSHNAANIADYDAVVYTVAIGADNPEYLAAQAAGKPLLSRADYLGYLMVSYRHRVGVAGMHGKSSCTAMCAQIFLQNADATVLCGAELP